MNEELQSTNEELSTINDELPQRTDVLAGQSDDGEVVIPAVNRRGRSIETRVKFSPLARGGDVGCVILLMEPVDGSS